LVDEVTTERRSRQLAKFEAWSEHIDADDLVTVDSSALQRIAELADQSAALDEALAEAVMTARLGGHSWSKIATMLGVTKQAAQQRYGKRTPAA
jgi:DNA-directed RNA polymerase specialized sigma24 family protein